MRSVKRQLCDPQLGLRPKISRSSRDHIIEGDRQIKWQISRAYLLSIFAGKGYVLAASAAYGMVSFLS